MTRPMLNGWEESMGLQQWIQTEKRIQSRHPGADIQWMKDVTAKEIEAARCYYNTKKSTKGGRYEIDYTKYEHGYNHLCHREDRAHPLKTLNIYKEEKAKVVPTRSSSMIGHRAVLGKLEPVERSHIRHMVATKGFLRSRGVGLAPDLYKF